MSSIHPDSSWRPLYEAALLERDEAKVAERIIAARTAILDRMEATLRNPNPGGNEL